jgi:UDP-N-acetylmuramoyl-tripeptide--D-alanyl-D-alanine ligase
MVGPDPSSPIKGFALDSREVQPGFLFIAIKGSKVDGHDFSAEVSKSGAVAVLAERPIGAPHILVPNVVQALADYASCIRSGFKGPVVGISGSAGKTTTKEFVAAALSPLGAVLKTEGNRNSEFSSPLLWADLTAEHKAVVVEMGMRGFGQVRHLASFTKPTVGVVTNIGHSHIELVGDQHGVAKAKAELLEALPKEGHAVLWAEEPFLETLSAASAAPVSTFGFSDKAFCRVTNYKALSWQSCEITGTLQGKEFKAVLPAVGRHIAMNAACAVLVAHLCGVDLKSAADGIEKANLPPMRMEIVNHGGATILLDAYNASPASVGAALETLCEMPVEGRRVAVLGDMRELGDYAEEGHRKVGCLAAKLGLDELIIIGELARWIGDAALESGLHASNLKHVETVEEVSAIVQQLQPGDAVLIKGSRALELERALDFLKDSTE